MSCSKQPTRAGSWGPPAIRGMDDPQSSIESETSAAAARKRRPLLPLFVAAVYAASLVAPAFHEGSASHSGPPGWQVLAMGWLSGALIPWGNGPWALIAWCANFPALVLMLRACTGERVSITGAVLVLVMSACVFAWNGTGVTAEVGPGSVDTPHLGMWLWLTSFVLLAAHAFRTRSLPKVSG